MKKLSIFAVAAFACLCLIGVMSGEVFADGDDTLGLGLPSIQILPGSRVVAAGVGMINADVMKGGDISVYVPHGAEIQQVLLYWEGRGYLSTPDKKVMVRKRLPEEESDWKNVEDEVMIGASAFLNSKAYRADVTGLELVVPGHSLFSVKGLDFTHNDGAGVIVIFNDASGDADVQLLDGNDYAFWGYSETTVAKTFAFETSLSDQTATLSMFFSSVAGAVSGGGFRTSSIEVTVAGPTISTTTTYENLFNSWDGEEWDTLNIDVNIPVGANSLTVQPLSSGATAASFNWIVTALSVPEAECGPCEGKISELTLKYTGAPTDFIEVFQKKDPVPIFAGNAAHDGEFTFVGTDKNGTMGTEISIFVDDELNTKIHTSCSQPIGPGLVSGDFEVISGYSKDGGLLCPTDEDDDCECDGKVTWLKLLNTGPKAEIDVYQKKPNVLIFTGVVASGEPFDFFGQDDKGTMSTEITIKVNGSEYKIHTSCSQPIGPGLISGDFLVIEGESLKGGPLCPM